MAGIGGHDRAADGEPRGIAQVILVDDFTQFFDDPGEHRLRLVTHASARDAAAAGTLYDATYADAAEK
ncbi:hypothetical protein MBRA_42990 [Mycobacterium branderi]|uniref:Uncharacterized protein n=1 Tax=Mycobacterium branderi TaxID=43348 RepID=A0ABM7KSM7_9MYCO|nr:hypothetical protein MBRA_42990 [Mycobacterium branderi]